MSPIAKLGIGCLAFNALAIMIAVVSSLSGGGKTDLLPACSAVLAVGLFATWTALEALGHP